MISLIYGILTKQNKPELTHTENRLGVAGGRGMDKWMKVVKRCKFSVIK